MMSWFNESSFLLHHMDSLSVCLFVYLGKRWHALSECKIVVICASRRSFVDMYLSSLRLKKNTVSYYLFRYGWKVRWQRVQGDDLARELPDLSLIKYLQGILGKQVKKKNPKANPCMKHHLAPYRNFKKKSGAKVLISDTTGDLPRSWISVKFMPWKVRADLAAHMRPTLF